ncbi:MAG: tetratricopeptide repeat protein [Bryobacteraceae bacterium]
MLRCFPLILFMAVSTSAQQQLEHDAASVSGRLAQANAYFKTARLSEAKDIADQVLRVQPKNEGALEIKGNVQYLKGEVSAAIDTFISLLDLHPENQEAPYMLGRIYYQESRVDQAMGQFQRVLKINPRSYKAYDNLGLCYEAKGDKDKAIRYFLTAIKLVEIEHPEYDSAYANLADLLLKTGDAQKAFDAASKATKRNPNSARDFYIGAKALEQLGKLDLSLNWLQRSVALDPNYPEPQYLLSRVYRQLGQPEKAEQARKKFLEAKSKEPGTRR